MKYEVIQTNRFSYRGPVRRSINQFRLKPMDDKHQICLSYEKRIVPEATCYAHTDFWGNHVETFYLWEPHDSLLIETTSIVEVACPRGEESLASSNKWIKAFEGVPFKQEYAEYLTVTDYTSLNKEKMEYTTEELWKHSQDPFDFVKQLNAYLYNHLKYIPGATTVETRAEEVLDKKEGVCQDYTHLMLALCRYRGIPSRYVSGYIYTGENSAMRGDAATHAWLEIAMPEIGWVGFDPTNNMMANEHHVKLAVGRDYKDIVPVKGIYIGGEQELEVKVRVKKMDEV